MYPSIRTYDTVAEIDALVSHQLISAPIIRTGPASSREAMESLWSSSWKSDEAAEDLIERLTDADLAAASSDAARSSGKDASRDIMDHDGDNPSSGACDFGKSPVALQQAIDFHRLGQVSFASSSSMCDSGY